MKKCIRCENKVNKENTLCDKCNELEKNQKGDKRIIVTIGIILLVLVIISLVFIAIIYLPLYLFTLLFYQINNKK